jgi:hypothetical protein
MTTILVTGAAGGVGSTRTPPSPPSWNKAIAYAPWYASWTPGPTRCVTWAPKSWSPTWSTQQLVGRAPISAAEFARRHAAAFTPGIHPLKET